MIRHGNYVIEVQYEPETGRLNAKTNLVLTVSCDNGKDAERTLKRSLQDITDLLNDVQGLTLKPHESSVWKQPVIRLNTDQIYREAQKKAEIYPDIDWGLPKKKTHKLRRVMADYFVYCLFLEQSLNNDELTKEEKVLRRQCLNGYELGLVYLDEVKKQAEFKLTNDEPDHDQVVIVSAEDYKHAKEAFEEWWNFALPKRISGDSVFPPDVLLPPEYFGKWAEILWPNQEPFYWSSEATRRGEIELFLYEHDKYGWESYGEDMAKRNRGWAIRVLQLPEFGSLSEQEARAKVGLNNT